MGLANLAQAQVSIPEQQSYNIDFGGGTPYEFRDQELQELGINVILPDTSQSIVFPEISLRNVTEVGLFHALTSLGANSNPPFEWQPSNEQPPIVLPNGTVIGDTGSNVWTLVPHISMSAMPFSVRDLLEEYSIDEITSAIEATIQAAAETQSRQSELEFRFHEATNLLIIVGYNEDLKLASVTIAALSH